MRKVSVAICCSLILSGCSSFSERHQASGDFEYLKQGQQSPLVIPQGLTPIAENHQYDIPKLGAKANVQLVGSKLDIRAPSQVMALAPDSLLVEDKAGAVIIFESFKNAEAVEAELWAQLNQFVTDKNYGVSMSQQGSSLTTRQIESDPFFKLVFGLEDQHSLSQQFQFNLSVEPQGHKATLAVTLANHQEQGSEVELNLFAQRRYETRMLNLMLSHLLQQEQLANISTRELATREMGLELGFDSQQSTAYIVQSSFEPAWEKLASVLPKLGFVVEDRDKTLGTYFVTFDPADNGFWGSLFSSDNITPLDLEQESYQVKLEKSGAQSILTISDQAGEKLSQEKMLEMSNTFKAVFAKKQL